MDGSLNIGKNEYISAGVAAKNFGYTQDYIGQLCRHKKIRSELVGRTWYVLEVDILNHKNSARKKNDTVSQKEEKIKSNKIPKRILNKKIKKEKSKEFLAENFDNKTTIYGEQNSDLFPKVVKKLDLERIKSLAIDHVDSVLSKREKRSGIERFVVSMSVAIFLLIASITFFGRNNLSSNLKHVFAGSPFDELALLYRPHFSHLQSRYFDFEKNVSIKDVSNKQIASVFLSDGVSSVFGWAKGITHKIIKPWLEDNVIIVKEVDKERVDVQEQESPVAVVGGLAPIIQSRTVLVPAFSMDYVDLRIEEKFNEIKNYFLTNPTAPNINRFYVTRQNDAIVDSISRNNSSSSGASSSGVSALADLSDLTLASLAYGDLLMYNGSEWVNVATSSLGITAGSGTFLGLTDTQSSFTANRIVHTNGAGTALTDTAGFVFDGSNLGIGTTTPYAPLSVVGQIVGAYFTGTTTATSTFGGNLAVNGTGTSTFVGGIDLSSGCFSINGSCVSGGSASFSGLSGGTNTSAAMLVGSGATLGPTGTGVLTANVVDRYGTSTDLAVLGSMNTRSVDEPTTAATVAEGTAGNLTGTFSYYVTFHTATGETLRGPISNSVTVTSKRIELTNIPISSDPTVTGRSIYRYNGSLLYKVSSGITPTINDNTTTTYTDNTSSITSNLRYPYDNTTGAILRDGKILVQSGFCTAIATGDDPAPCVYGGRWFTTAVGLGALDSLPNSNDTGFANDAFGVYALNNGNTINHNSAIGTVAMQFLINGTYNTCVGSHCQRGGNGGANWDRNTSVGAYSFHTLQGSAADNTCIGENCGRGITTGSRNTYVGAQSGYTNSTGSGNVFIGNDSGLNEIESNKFIIANNSTRDYPLLWGDFLKGTLNINSTSTNTTLYVQGTSTQPTYDLFNVASSTGTSLFKINAGGTLTVGSGGLLTTPYSSSTIYSSFAIASSTQWFGGGLTSCSNATSDKLLYNSTTGQFSCGSDQSGSSGYDAWTHPLLGLSATTSQILIGTSTASNYQLTVSSTTAPQLSLSAGAGLAQWVQRNAGGNLYISTTTVDGTATTSISALEIAGDGFGTTTVRGLNISGQATTTSNVGINLSGGCFAINGSCISGGAGSGASSTLLADFNTFSNTNNFNGSVGISTTSPFARLSINNTAGENAFVIGSSTATQFIVNSLGNVGIGTSSPYSRFAISVPSGFAEDLVAIDNNGVSQFRITQLAAGGVTESLIGINLNTSAPAASLDVHQWSPTGGSFRPSFIARHYLGGSLIQAGDSSGTAGVGLGYGIAPTSGTSLAVGYAGSSASRILSVTNTSGNQVSSVLLTLAAGNAGQTGDYLQVTNSAGTILSKITNTGALTVSTSSGYYNLTVASSSAAQLALSAGAGVSQWAFRNAGGSLYISTTTVDGTATTSISALEIAGDGFGTTTVRGLNISGQATTTSNVGINLTSGCYAINGSCISGGAGSGASSTLLADFNTFSNTNNFTGSVGISTTSPFARLSINNTAGENAFVIGSSTATQFIVDSQGRVGVGTTTPGAIFGVENTTTRASFMVSDQAGDTSPFIIDSTGNVGVGETALSLKLHVLSGEAEDTVRISNSNASGYASVHWDNNSSNEFYTGVGGSATTASFANKWYTYTPGGTLSLDTAGLMQWSGESTFIGASSKTLTDANDVLYMETDNAYTQFHMVNPDGANTDLSAFFSVNATGNAAFGSGDTNPGLQLWTQSAHPLRLATNATERIRIASTGAVGVSTTTPFGVYSLTIASTTAPQLSLSAGAGLAQWVQRNAGGNLYFATTTVAGTATTSLTALTILNDGNIGIGTTTPTGALSIVPNVNENTPFIVSSTSGATMLEFGISGVNQSLIIRDTTQTRYLSLSSSGSGGGQTVNSSGGTLILANNGSARVSITNGLTTYNQPMRSNSGNTTLTDAGYIGVGSTTPQYALTIASTTAPQLSLSDGAGLAQWVQRNAGGNFYLSTTTVDGTATTSISALEIAGDGFGTTTVRGLNISGQATTTSNVGINLSGGCFAINGTCVGGGAGSDPSIGGTLTSATAGSVLFAGSGTFAQDNTNFFFDDTNNRLGLGTTTPFAKLSVNSVAGETAFVVGSSTATSFIVNSLGNVGVKTLSPSDTLDVTGTGRFSSTLNVLGSTLLGSQTVGSNNSIRFNFGTGGTSAVHIHPNNTISSSASGYWINFNSTSPGTWANNVGNNSFTWVGITPAYGPTSNTQLSATGLDVSPSYNPSAGRTVWGRWVGLKVSPTFGNGDEDYNATSTIPDMTALAVEPTINVNTTSTTTYTALRLVVTETEVPSGTNHIIKIGTSTKENFLVVTNAGNVGVGTTSPWRTFSVDGTVAVPSVVNDSTGYYACINTTTGQLSTSTTACGASSLKYKENVSDIQYGLGAVMLMRPVSFDYRQDYMKNAPRQLGFIAEEVADIAPELVAYDKEGKIQGLDYPKFSAVLAKAIQELNMKVDNLQASASSSAYLINQGGVGPILQLQSNDQDRFMVASNGSISVLASANQDEQLFSIKNNESDVLIVNGRGDLKLAGSIVAMSDSFAGSIATNDMGIAEINFNNHLGTGKPSVQLTVEGDVLAIAQIASWKQDSVGNFVGLFIKTFGTEGQAVAANVHYAVFGKPEGYGTAGNALPSLINVFNNPNVTEPTQPTSSSTTTATSTNNNIVTGEDNQATSTPPVSSSSTPPVISSSTPAEILVEEVVETLPNENIDQNQTEDSGAITEEKSTE